MAIEEPWSARFMLISESFLSSFTAWRSLLGRLFLGSTIGISASCILTSSRYGSNAIDG